RISNVLLLMFQSFQLEIRFIKFSTITSFPVCLCEPNPFVNLPEREIKDYLNQILKEVARFKKAVER
ncbi:MAG: hypothetical protein WBF33_11880, partial [Candidatus Nitrosopolaris sp.]